MSDPQLARTKLALRGLGIRQEDLAEVAGVSRYTVTKYLNGRARWVPGRAIGRLERAIELLCGADARELLHPERRRKVLLGVAQEIAEGKGDRPPGGRCPGRTVLVADDEEAVRALLTTVFTGAGFEVLTAADGAEALEVATAHPGPVDLIVSDVVMPRLKGPEMVARLRSRHPETPVLYLSGSFDREGLPEPGRAGTARLAKPFTAKELLEEVGRLLAGC